MTLDHLRMVLRDGLLSTPIEIAVYVTLWQHGARSTGVVERLARRTIATEAACSEGSVFNAIRTLERKGLVRGVSRGRTPDGREAAKKYEILDARRLLLTAAQASADARPAVSGQVDQASPPDEEVVSEEVVEAEAGRARARAAVAGSEERERASFSPDMPPRFDEIAVGLRPDLDRASRVQSFATFLETARPTDMDALLAMAPRWEGWLKIEKAPRTSAGAVENRSGDGAAESASFTERNILSKRDEWEATETPLELATRLAAHALRFDDPAAKHEVMRLAKAASEAAPQRAAGGGS